jgi:hypothetical protein
MSRNRAVVVWAAVALAVVSTFGIVGWHWSDGTRGDLATWLGASATLAAVVAAAIAAVFAAEAFGLERRRDIEREREAFAAQAQQIAVWIHALKKGGIGYVVQNASSLPIYGVRLALEAVEGEEIWERWPIDVVPPGLFERQFGPEADNQWEYSSLSRDEIMDDFRERSERAAARGETVDVPPFPRDLRAMIQFQDVRGSHWERDFGGRLKIVWPGDTRAHGDALNGRR